MGDKAESKSTPPSQFDWRQESRRYPLLFRLQALALREASEYLDTEDHRRRRGLPPGDDRPDEVILATAPGQVYQGYEGSSSRLYLVLATDRRLIVLRHTWYTGHVVDDQYFPYVDLIGWKATAPLVMGVLHWTTKDLQRGKLTGIPRKLLRRLRGVVEPRLPATVLGPPGSGPHAASPNPE